ncbi:uncharacterized protein JCM15063_003948 [Sporobolomyces koalae]|uniref:uncharacterized protein n=1 Tax=Sporobolomyces koalae TaxID=500713 RepID=UPI003174B63F
MSDSEPYVLWHQRPGWEDVVPVPQDDAPNCLVPIAYHEYYRDAMDTFRALVQKGEKSKRTLELTEDIIQMNPGHYSVWKFRADTLLELKTELVEELALLDRMVKQHLKSYQVWQHRRTIVLALNDPSRELEFTAKALSFDAKNYHTWAYRQFVLCHFYSDAERSEDDKVAPNTTREERQQVWDAELAYVEKLLDEDIRNNSAWNQRFFVAFESQMGGETQGVNVGEREIEFVKAKLALSPNNPSAWNYLRGVLKRVSIPLSSVVPFVTPLALNTPESMPPNEPPVSDKAQLPAWLAIEFLADAKLEQAQRSPASESGEMGQQAAILFRSLVEYDPIRRFYWEHLWSFPRAVAPPLGSLQLVVARSIVHSPRSIQTVAKRPKVLLMDRIELAKSVETRLANQYDLITMDSQNREEFKRDCLEKYQGVEAIYRHFKGASTKVTGLFDQQLVQDLPRSLKFICHNGAGYDQIDISACTSRKIQVSNVPVAVDDATADTALFLLLGSLRQFGLAQTNLREGRFNSGLSLSNDPKGKVLGIVGMGGIGRAFAKRAQSLGMVVQYHNRNRLGPELELGARYVETLDELLESSDVVSLNLPLNSRTHGLIGIEQLRRMKRSAILINTARGGVIDEPALVEALESGEIAGCGLDVYQDEPRIHEGLIKNDRAFLLPHVGTLTLETQTEMEAVCLRNIETGIQTGKLGFTVPEQKGLF